jgi:hypothetical protein
MYKWGQYIYIGFSATLHLQCMILGYMNPQVTHTEWQRPLSGVHSIMMEKLGQAGEGGGCTPTPFHLWLP